MSSYIAYMDPMGYDEKCSFSHIRHNVLLPSQEAGYIRFEDENLTTVEEFQENASLCCSVDQKISGWILRFMDVYGRYNI